MIEHESKLTPDLFCKPFINPYEKRFVAPLNVAFSMTAEAQACSEAVGAKTLSITHLARSVMFQFLVGLVFFFSLVLPAQCRHMVVLATAICLAAVERGIH